MSIRVRLPSSPTVSWIAVSRRDVSRLRAVLERFRVARRAIDDEIVLVGTKHVLADVLFPSSGAGRGKRWRPASTERRDLRRGNLHRCTAFRPRGHSMRGSV